MTTIQWLFWIAVLLSFLTIVGGVSLVLARYLNSRAFAYIASICAGGIIGMLVIAMVVVLVWMGALAYS